MNRRGFTIIEIMIVIAVMAIILVIGTVSVRGYLANARDKERESDIASIQSYLESIYPREITDAHGNVIKPAGSYPAHFYGYSRPLYSSMRENEFNSLFADAPDTAKKGPLDGEVLVSAKRGVIAGPKNINILSDINQYKDSYDLYKADGRPNGAYIYFAHDHAGTRCDRKGYECRQYKILYHLETKSPNNWQVAESRHK